MNLSEEKALLELTEEAIKTHQMKPEELFLFKLFNFKFSYDDDQEVCTMEVPLHEIMLGPLRFIHGGFITYLADTCMGHLCFKYLDSPFVALELKTQYLKSVQDGIVVAEARFRQKGKTIIFIDCEVKTKEGLPLSTISATFYVLPNKNK
jgi:uncharacterized protein (TIGR00369 family)